MQENIAEQEHIQQEHIEESVDTCLLYTSPSPRDS